MYTKLTNTFQRNLFFIHLVRKVRWRLRQREALVPTFCNKQRNALLFLHYSKNFGVRIRRCRLISWCRPLKNWRFAESCPRKNASLDGSRGHCSLAQYATVSGPICFHWFLWARTRTRLMVATTSIVSSSPGTPVWLQL